MSVKEKIGCVTTVILSVVFLVSIFSYFLFRPAPVYETNDVADYGVIKGNYDNETPKEFVFSFFPKTIEEYFSDVSYHYKAIKLDSYAYEIALEFTILDKQQYFELKEMITGNTICSDFEYAPEYQVFWINDYLLISEQEEYNRIDPPVIQDAEIGLILFSDSNQQFIYIALGAYDGGGVTTEELNYFFDRFHVNPWRFGTLLR